MSKIARMQNTYYSSLCIDFIIAGIKCYGRWIDFTISSCNADCENELWFNEDNDDEVWVYDLIFFSPNALLNNSKQGRGIELPTLSGFSWEFKYVNVGKFSYVL